ncbi:MAG: REP element-mobilizing transposase RayT [Planctomycetota bacterium]|jgi:REP element-mobilizing transposase RayT
MARHSRLDHPGSWHHVINRGLAKRPLFEDRADVRFFLSRLAREVRRGRLELHGWCVLTTHFHLLVRSPVGELSEALRRSQNEYSRFFNRRHKRDGTLVRGRFFSKPVTTLSYRRTLVRYIDNNAVKAGLARTPWSYRWCSAAQYAFASGPAWLERSWVESEANPHQSTPFRGRDYVRTFGGPFSEAADRLVESRILSKRLSGDDLDNLVGSAPPRVLAWMKRKTNLADGGRIGLPVCDALSIQEAVQSARKSDGEWKVSPNGHGRCAWGLIEVGLLRMMAGRTWEQIAFAVGSTLSSCQRRLGMHHRLVEEDATYALGAAKIAATALSLCHPAPGRPNEIG